MYYIESRNGRIRIVNYRGDTVLQNEIAEPSIYVNFLDMIMRDIIVIVGEDGKTLNYVSKFKNPIQTYRYGDKELRINFSRINRNWQ